MSMLETTHPDIAREFKNGQFVMRKTKRRFSSIAIDQGHEQNNAVMKDDGGIIGITQDSAALTRWCLTGPETVRVTEKFES